MATKPTTSTETPDAPRLYGDLAWLWPLLSPPGHYAEEAATLRAQYRTLRTGPTRQRPTLLDLGAGGGHVLSHLTDDFECTAVDRSSQMLDCCARLLPAVTRVRGDLRTLRLDRSFDVVLLHDAVDYMATSQDVDRALCTAAAHLDTGGVLFVAPTYTRENFVDGDSEQDRHEPADVTYFSYVHDPDPTDTEYELLLLYLLRHSETRQVKVIEDRHRCGLFSERQWLAALDRAGLSAQRVEDDKAWTLFAGLKRPDGRHT